ncbi:Uncharacterised protein [Oligella ureolytica]|uniref:Uncharacterized protein n=1 Tax=Oligella ureolytica TaxID=90244 RepID=A0A378XFB1_9BURK|nr:Uncharacterised protein [Oligella ureolytica]SUA58232.1 Uncharacterised protein [Oligella ureolytica]
MKIKKLMGLLALGMSLIFTGVSSYASDRRRTGSN